MERSAERTEIRRRPVKYEMKTTYQHAYDKVTSGMDIYEAAWLWSNVAFGLALIPLAIWLSKKFGDRIGRFPMIQRFMKDLAGYNLNAAADFLATLSEFEKEKREN